MLTSEENGAPDKCFVHPHATHFVKDFYFYAFGDTPPTDLLQHIPHDAARANILSLGCGDLRNLLYFIQLHGRRGVSCGPVPRELTFTLNDWEPAIHARNLVMLQLILDSRVLLAPVETGMLDGRIEATGRLDSPASSATAEAKIGDATLQVNETVSSKACNTNAGPQARPVCPAGAAGRQEHHAHVAQWIGLLFSAMYNVFVDADVLRTIQDVAGRLSACIASSAEWNSTELGSLVHFTDDRSQDRVRDILTLYADTSLQTRCSASSVKKQRSAFIRKHISKGTITTSRAMGLASLRQEDSSVQANNEMNHEYLVEGVLDPFPLLLSEKKTPNKRKPSNFVNPLLLVTERRSTAYSLHYAAFPLDAFHTEVASWKLREESTQPMHGKLAPRVLRMNAAVTHNCKKGSSTASAKRGVKNARFGAALEQLSQMCGGFLAATAILPSGPGVITASATAHLRINVNVGDAINFCDAMLASSTTSPTAGDPENGGGLGTTSSGSATFRGIAFQQGALQPLRLRKDTFVGPRAEFDVISTSTLAEHLGAVNILVATAPLLGLLPHSVLLTSLLASANTEHLHKDTEALYNKLLCMTSQAAAILLGVVPVSSLSSVVGHADITTIGLLTESKSVFARRVTGPRILRLTWKRPAQASAATDSLSGATYILGSISPSNFADLTLPVYKAMFAHMPTTGSVSSGVRGLTEDEAVEKVTGPKNYTSASFGRLLALAGRRLRLETVHFQAALRAIINDSGIYLARNLTQEQEGLFQALGLVPISNASLAVPLDTRRVVLLVPASGLSLLREFTAPAVYLALCGKQSRFDNHFVSVHMTFVRARRGGSEVVDNGRDWCSLTQHLEVRDTREDDPEAELMVSAIVPTYALMMAPPSLTELQLRPQDSAEVFQAPAHVMRKLGGLMLKVFYGANLANKDRTAVLMPGGSSWKWKGRSSSPPLACPERAVSSRSEEVTPFSSATGTPGAPSSPFLQRFKHGNSVVDQSLELISQPGHGRGGLLMGRVKLVMTNREAREQLAKGRIPHVEGTQDPCSVRVVLGEDLVHTASFPYPVICTDVRVVYTKSQGYAYFVVFPCEGLLEVPFSLTAVNVETDGRRTLLSTFCWPICVPLASLPRLDFNAEWAHPEVMGPMSGHHAERSSQEQPSSRPTPGPHLGFRGMKESIFDIAASACATHTEDSLSWKHAWACITNNQRQDEPTLWVWVNEILLDPSNQALVLDCCILPVDRMDDEASIQLGAIVGGMATNFMQACHEEIKLWMALLPVAVERARQTYKHASDCFYSTQSGDSPTVCSCGMGKDLPHTFMESMKPVKAVAISALMYRTALSPLYARLGEATVSGSTTGCRAGDSVSCTKCGKGGSSMACSRCRKVTYCSKDCQRDDWKNHKPQCAAKPGSAKP